MKDYILLSVLPVLLPPAVGAWKGTKWGIAVLVGSMVVFFLIDGLDSLPWLIGTLVGAALLFLQWVAVRFGSRGSTDKQEKQ